MWIRIPAVFAFKFPGRRHFEFYDVIWLLHIWLLWRRPGNLKAKTAGIRIHIFGTLKLSLHFLEK